MIIKNQDEIKEMVYLGTLRRRHFIQPRIF